MIAGNTVRQPWLYLDINGAGLTGMVNVTDVTLTLRVDTGTGGGAAAEPVSWTEKGSGFYDIAFAPVGQGLYTLFLKELNVGGMQRQWAWTFEVSAAGAVFTPAYANAFCAESDIEAWLGMDITSSTTPTSTQLSGLAQTRAAVLMAMMAGWGYTVTPLTLTNGSRLQDILRQANCIGAALDASLMQQFRLTPNVTDRISILQAMWDQYVGREGAPGSPVAHIPGYLEVEIKMNLASLGTDHILSGDTQAADPTYPQDPGPFVNIGTVY